MSDNKHLTPVWIVYVDGKRLDTEHEGVLLSITVTDKINGISSCSLLFDTSAVKLRDKGTFVLESEISVHLGYKDDCAEVFKGEITAFRTVFAELGAESLEVKCHNVLHKLTHARNCSVFTEKTPEEIIKALLDTYSLKAKLDPFGAKLDFRAEQTATDYEYLYQLATAYGKTIYAYDTTVYVQDEITFRNNEIIFEWGKTLISFSAKEDIDNILSGCTFVGWDSLKNEAFEGTATLNDLNMKIGGASDWTKISKGGSGLWKCTFVDHSLFDSDDAKKHAIGFLQKNNMEFCTAEGCAEGNCKLFAGMRVNIKYTGKAVSGEYIADTVTHIFNNRQGYRTDFTLKRNMNPC